MKFAPYLESYHEDNKARAEIRKYAKQRWNMVCAECGSIFNIHIHHRDGNPQNNNFANILLLCRKCHEKKHFSKKR